MGQMNMDNNNHSPRQHYPQRPYGGDQSPQKKGPQRPPKPQRPQRPPMHGNKQNDVYEEGGYHQGGYDDYGGDHERQERRRQGGPPQRLVGNVKRNGASRNKW